LTLLFDIMNLTISVPQIVSRVLYFYCRFL